MSEIDEIRAVKNETIASAKNLPRSSAAFSVTFRIKLPNKPGNFSRVLQYFGDSGALIAEVNMLASEFDYKIREVTVHCRNERHSHELIDGLKGLEDIQMLHWQDDTLAMHECGKIAVAPKAVIKSRDALSRAYTPGVARVCNIIAEKPEEVYRYTVKCNSVAVVSDGSAVLGLGNIGPTAGLPVMEGKAMLFKQFGNIDAYPICLATQDTEEIIRTVRLISPVFGGINLEDISAPRCFEIEARLKNEIDIPVFHDDQHGTAVVVLAGMINALKIVGKQFPDLKVVVSGFGAGGVACTNILYQAGVRNIIPFDSHGAIYRGRTLGMNAIKEELIKTLNPDNERGTLSEAMRGADVFLGVSKPNMISVEDVKSMTKGAIVFALANPNPEIMPDQIRGIAAVVASGRSDYPNQVNNVLCFPGIFRGALDCRAKAITEKMKIAAAQAISESVSASELGPDCVIPGIFNMEVRDRVAEKVKEAARKEGVARI